MRTGRPVDLANQPVAGLELEWLLLTRTSRSLREEFGDEQRPLQMGTDIIHLGKLEVASRQTAEAIRMFFLKKDPIVIHTVIYAAHSILSDLCKAKGLDSLIRNNPLLRPESASEWHNLMSHAGNFLKHADRDPDKVLEFRPSIIGMFIVDSVRMTYSLTGALPREHNVFLLWFNASNPHLLVDNEYKKVITGALADGLDMNDFETISLLLD